MYICTYTRNFAYETYICIHVESIRVKRKIKNQREGKLTTKQKKIKKKIFFKQKPKTKNKLKKLKKSYIFVYIHIHIYIYNEKLKRAKLN